MTKRITAFSLVETVIVVLFIGILAAVTVPRLNLAVISRYKAEATAKKIVADLRRTRRLAISDAATNSEGFGLEMVGAGPYTGYKIVNQLDDSTIDSHTIDPAILCTGGQRFLFGYLGNLKPTSDSQLAISASGKAFAISIAAATGTVKCAEN